MPVYRASRNIEASFIDFLTTNFALDWTDVTVEKSFARVYKIEMAKGEAVVCVRLGTTEHEFIEVGSDSTWRFPNVLVDIFATSDGQRLDLKDYIVSKIKGGLPYYEYVTTNGAVDWSSGATEQSGRIRVLSIDDTPINFDNDKNILNKYDRYRHLLTVQTNIGQVE